MSPPPPRGRRCGTVRGCTPAPIRLAHNGTANGRVLASVTTFDGNNGIGESPVRVANPTANYCQNYSAPLLPSADGRQVLQIATDWDGTVCKPYYATGGITGSGDAAGVADGALYRLVNANSGRCLDVAEDSRLPGGNVQQGTCNGLGPQQWTLRARGGNQFTLTARNSGYCLDVQDGSQPPGANVRQWHCNSLAAQDCGWRMSVAATTGSSLGPAASVWTRPRARGCRAGGRAPRARDADPYDDGLRARRCDVRAGLSSCTGGVTARVGQVERPVAAPATPDGDQRAPGTAPRPVRTVRTASAAVAGG